MVGDPGIFVGVETAEGLPASAATAPPCDATESNSWAVFRGHGNLICLCAHVPMGSAELLGSAS